MCGFFASNDSRIGKHSQSVLSSGLDFRGPDSQSGVITFGSWSLYHARLAIIAPVPEYEQPFACPDGSLLIFNGEIFNFRELGRKHLGHEFDSDTACLAHLLTREDFDLAELDGFFAFVRISADGELLNCARDHLGVKPLFILRNGSTLSISSEPGVLRKLFDLDLNPQAEQEYRIFRAPIFSGSFFSAVTQVEPGTCLVKGRFFDSLDHVGTEFEGNLTNDDVLLAMQKSIASRYIADVPVGLLYSGGVDSNLIRCVGKTVTRYSIGFDGDYDLEYSRSTAGNDVVLMEATAEQFEEHFSYLLELRQEPMSVPNEVLLSILAMRARQDGVKVLLSGEGADEFFAGYDRIYTWAAQAEVLSVDEFCNYYGYSSASNVSWVVERLAEVFASFGSISPFEKVRQFFVKYHLPLLFRRLDFALMSSGIEGREPLASVLMYTTAMKFSASELMHQGLGKKPLRDLLAKHMGEEFAFRQKIGFPVDLKRVFAEDAGVQESSYDIWFRKNMEVFS